MKQFVKRLAALALSGLLCTALLSGCAKDGEGMALAVCVGSAPESLDPIYAEDTEGQTVLAHLYENLMRVTVDSTGKTSVLPGMAKSVDQEEETKEGAITVTYTFRLRSARWSDGQPVTAGDFVYAWQRLANPATGSRYADLLSVVKGYQEARAIIWEARWASRSASSLASFSRLSLPTQPSRRYFLLKGSWMKW